MKTAAKYQHNLELNLQCDRSGKTFCHHQYTSYPFRLSPVFRLEGQHSQRAYLYLMNTSPGLLSGDQLNISLKLDADTSLYLTDQSATKVHQMPDSDKATINNQIVVNKDASLELVLEPIILYRDSILEQSTSISIHPTAKLFLSEIILPGRLARDEYYDFNYYFNRLQITNLERDLLFADATKLIGKDNPFKDNKLFSSLPIIGNAIAILPGVNLNIAIDLIENIKPIDTHSIETSTTVLPTENGIAVRVLGAKSSHIKQHFTEVIQQIRQLTNQSSLPYIPK